MRSAIPIMAAICLISVARAGMHQFHFVDPVGDHTGNTDIVRMDFTFDDATGDYTILLTTDEANPFQGDFRVNINLFNPDTGTTARYPSFFKDTLNDYFDMSSTSTLTLIGTAECLLLWETDDRVATSNVPFGNPDGSSSFRSGVNNLPMPEGAAFRDDVAYGNFYSVIDGSPVFVPLPGGVLLGTLGLGITGLRLRRHMV